jgi:hypothetical protein
MSRLANQTTIGLLAIAMLLPAVAALGQTDDTDAQVAPTMDQKMDNLAELEAQAPKGYPTVFVVASASESPGNPFGGAKCSIRLATLGTIYFAGSAGGLRPCKIFAPGTMIYGRAHQEPLRTVVDLLDREESKPRNRRYVVTGMQLVDLNPQ